MGAALEIIVIPVLLMIALIFIGMWTDLALATILIGAFAIALLVGVVIGLLRVEWRAETEDDKGEPHNQLLGRDELDVVEECGEESFPASDAPSWTLGPSRPSA